MKLVVQAIPAYIMNCFTIPMSICGEIEGMINKFFWGGDVTERKIYWIRWDRLARPKQRPGLGFLSFKVFNTALLAKQWWRLKTVESSLVPIVLKAVYYKKLSILLLIWLQKALDRAILGIVSLRRNG